ncbi:MAG TPA: phage holin family protein [Candidatus Binatia bacterium]|jgi:uncharacterized membrane protein YqjE
MSIFENENYREHLQPPRFSDAFKAVLGALGAALHTRLELFVTELEEERERFKRIVLLSLVGIVGLSFGFILLVVFLAAMFIVNGWLIALGGLGLFFLVLGAIAVLMVRNTFRNHEGLFPATMAELGKDRDHLRSAANE